MDDGKMEGRIQSVSSDHIGVIINRAPEKGAKLKGEKVQNALRLQKSEGGMAKFELGPSTFSSLDLDNILHRYKIILPRYKHLYSLVPLPYFLVGHQPSR